MSLAGDIAKLIGHSLHVGYHIGKENWRAHDNRVAYQASRDELIERERKLVVARQRYLEIYTNPELEKQYVDILENPDGFEPVWELLESSLRERDSRDPNGVYSSRYDRMSEYWEFARAPRKPFLFEDGSTVGESAYQTKVLEENRYKALILLMDLHRKEPIKLAKKMIEDDYFLCLCFGISPAEIRRW